jgi:hypothetical protein
MMILPKQITSTQPVVVLSLSDGYFDLPALSKYSCLGVPTLRTYLKIGLPHFRLKGKILIKRSEFDQWLESYRVNKKKDLKNMVDDVMANLKK